MTIHILTNQETQEISAKLHGQFGIKKIPGILLKIGPERIFLYQGSLNEQEIKELEKNIPIERLGVYFAKMHGEEVRLSIEGTQILKEQITKNIFELENSQLGSWMKGNEILLDDYNKFDETDILNDDNKKANKDSALTFNNKFVSDSEPISGEVGGNNSVKLKPNKGFLIIKYKDDFLGTGKASENKISNFIPKNRRLRERS